MTSSPPRTDPAVLVPLAAPARQIAAMRDEIDDAIASVLDGTALVLGPAHDEFEAAFAAYCGVGHAIGVANGTDALELALRAVGVSQASEVVTVANAGGYTTTATLAIGARPVFVDIDEHTLQMDPTRLAAALSERTGAVVLTHLYGQLADVEAVASLCTAAGVPLLEDCAQAHGALRDGRRAGSFGTVGTFSFYPTKNLGALGDGGAVVTSDREIADRVRRLRQYGWSTRYTMGTEHGRNSRLDELQAAVLLRKLQRLDAWNERRRAIVARYRSEASPAVRVTGSEGPDNVGHLAVVWCNTARDAVAAALAARGVATAVHYPVPDHHQPALAGLGLRATPLPVTERAVQHVLTVPCFPELTDDELELVTAALRDLR